MQGLGVIQEWAPGRSSELVERLLEHDSCASVSQKPWAALGRLLALDCGRTFRLQSYEQCQDECNRSWVPHNRGGGECLGWALGPESSLAP